MAFRHNFYKYHPPVKGWDRALYEYQSAEARVSNGVTLISLDKIIDGDAYKTVSIIKENKLVLFDKGERPTRVESNDGWGWRDVGGRESSLREISPEELEKINPEWRKKYNSILEEQEAKRKVLEERDGVSLQEKQVALLAAWKEVEKYFERLFESPDERRSGNIETWSCLQSEAREAGIIPAEFIFSTGGKESLLKKKISKRPV